MEQDKCPMCLATVLGPRRTRDITVGRMSPTRVAEEFDMTKEEVMDHINKHEVVEPEPEVQSVPNIEIEMTRLFNKLKEWSELIIIGEKSDRGTIETAVKLVAEMRKTLETFAALEGKLSKGNTYIYIQNMETRVQLMTSIILEEACGPCKLKILKAIEESPILIPART